MFSSTTLKGCKLLQIIKFMANLLMRSNLAISVFFESPPSPPDTSSTVIAKMSA